MKNIFCVLILCVALFGCDVASDIKGMFNKQRAVQNLVKEKYGWEAQVGFNIHNGVLSHVALVLSANDVREESVARLEAIAREVVSASFASTPKAIYIQITSTADEKS